MDVGRARIHKGVSVASLVLALIFAHALAAITEGSHQIAKNSRDTTFEGPRYDKLQSRCLGGGVGGFVRTARLQSDVRPATKGYDPAEDAPT